MTKPTLLLVEDDRALADLLIWHFDREGYEVARTADGDEALVLAEERTPDLVILDWMIEGVSGIEVCRRLRRRASTAHVPIIMLTARGEESDRIRGLETGADDYVTKPFSPRELLARVGAVLRRMRPALAGEQLSYADIEMDVEAHRVRRDGRPVQLGPDGVSIAAPLHGASRPGLLARAAARRGLGTRSGHRCPHRRRSHPAASQSAQRRRLRRHDPHCSLGRLLARRRRLNAVTKVKSELSRGGPAAVLTRISTPLEECVKPTILAIAAAALLTAACGTNSGNESGQASAASQQITGAGSTFVYPVLSAWAADYQKQSGARINYQSIGSGGGISQVKAGTVDFGATDQPLASDELAKANLAQFPIVIGGIVAVVNLPGFKPGQLKLTGPLLADIYAGKVKSWSDPVIAELNPGVKLPSANIAVVHRSDGSGTTFNFTHYLSQVSPVWKSGPGEGKTVSWPTGVGGKGNEGVANYVKQIPNSIGYVEYAYVVQSGMAYAQLQNAAGTFVSPSAETFSGCRAIRGLGEGQRLQPGDDQRAGRERLSDHRDDLHPDAEAAEGQSKVRRGAELLPICAGEGAGRRRTSSTMSRFPKRS